MQDELHSMRVAPKRSDVSDDRPMSFEEKQALCASIQTLPVEHLNMIVNIIQQGMPQSQQDDEIEIDIDAMPPTMLRAIERYIEEVGKKKGADEAGKD